MPGDASALAVKGTAFCCEADIEAVLCATLGKIHQPLAGEKGRRGDASITELKAKAESDYVEAKEAVMLESEQLSILNRSKTELWRNFGHQTESA